MTNWVAVTWGQAIPCFVVGLVLYFLRLCGVRTSKLNGASWLREILVFLAFLLHIATFVLTMKLPKVSVASSPAEINGTSPGWVEFAKIWYILVVLRLCQEDLVKIAFASTWLSMAVIYQNKNYHRFVRAVFVCQVLHILRVFPVIFYCAPVDYNWQTGYLKGYSLHHCWDRQIPSDLIMTTTIVGEVILWVTPIPAIMHLAPGRQRNLARIAIGFFGIASAISLIIASWMIIRIRMINEPDSVKARDQLLRDFQLTCLRPALVLCVPCFSAAVQTLRNWRRSMRGRCRAQHSADLQLSERTVDTSDGENETQKAAGPQQQKETELITCEVRTERVLSS